MAKKGWLDIAGQGAVAVDRVVAVARVESAAGRRLLAATPLERVVTLSGGKKRLSLLVLDSGHLVLTPLSVEQIERLLMASEDREI
jgi:regulator of extracellular matrix RemA (YlzA/DUF370 family)